MENKADPGTDLHVWKLMIAIKFLIVINNFLFPCSCILKLFAFSVFSIVEERSDVDVHQTWNV